MNDWTCQTCGNSIRNRIRAPFYCPRCGLSDFRIEDQKAAPPTPRPPPVSPSVRTLRTSPSAGIAELQNQSFTAIPASPEPRPQHRPAKRIRPKDPLEVRLPRTVPLEAVDISATGLLVEHVKPFTPGSICEVEVWRSCMGIRLRAEVVRSVVSNGGRGSQTGIRYRTAVHFLETPQIIFTLLPELSEEA